MIVTICVGVYLLIGFICLSAWSSMGDVDLDAWDCLIVIAWPLLLPLYVLDRIG